MHAERTDIEIATSIAVEAGKLARTYSTTNRHDMGTKGSRDIVTQADVASEQLIRSRLLEAFPDDGLLGEEGSSQKGRNGRRWYIDPIDGTYNFSQAIPFWCVSLGRFDDGVPALGVIHDAVRGETFSTESPTPGEQNVALRVSATAAPERAIVHLTTDFTESTFDEGLIDLQRLHGTVLRTRNFGSVALALAYVAVGRIDAVIHRRANIWDFAAGVALVQGAGGRVTAADGSEFQETSRTVLAASTEELHDRLLRCIQP